MNSHFIITSAIYTSYGKLSTEERILQTRETLKSIKNYAPNSSLILLDCGEKSIEKNLFDCKVIDYTTNQEIQSYLQQYLKYNKDIEPDIVIKSMLEIMMCEDYFKKINKSHYSRIFKICGRYKLNSEFDYSKHINAKDKVVILFPKKSQHLYNFNVSVSPLQYKTRLWSFDISILPKIINTYSKMKKEIIKISKSKTQGDIEHLLYKHLNKKYVEHVKNIGVEGYWSPRKLWIGE